MRHDWCVCVGRGGGLIHLQILASSFNVFRSVNVLFIFIHLAWDRSTKNHPRMDDFSVPSFMIRTRNCKMKQTPIFCNSLRPTHRHTHD